MFFCYFNLNMQKDIRNSPRTVLEYCQGQLVNYEVVDIAFQRQGPQLFCFLRDKTVQSYLSLLLNSIIWERWLYFVLWIQGIYKMHHNSLLHVMIYTISMVFFVISILLRRLFLRKIRTDSREFTTFRNNFNYELEEADDKEKIERQRSSIKQQRRVSKISRVVQPVMFDRSTMTKEQIQLKTLITKKEAGDLQPGDIIIIERNQIAPADLLVLDISGRSAAKDLSFLDQREPQMLIPPCLTHLPKKNDCSQLGPQYLKLLNMTITVVGKDQHRTATLKYKGNPKFETVGHEAFMIKDSKLVGSQWALAVVVARDSSDEYYRHLFRKSRTLQQYNIVLLYLLVAEALSILFTIIIQRKIANPQITNPLTNQLIQRCINLNFHLPLLYLIYDALDIVFTLGRLWRSVLENDYFLESDNNLEMMARKLVIDPAVLAQKKYMEVIDVVTSKGAVLAETWEELGKTLEDEIQGTPCVHYEDEPNEITTPMSIKLTLSKKEEDIKNTEKIQCNPFVHPGCYPHFHLIRTIILTMNNECRVNKQGIVQSLYFQGIDQMFDQFLNQTKSPYLLKYFNPDTEKVISCYKVGSKVFKAEMFKEGFEGALSYSFVRYLDDPLVTRQSLLLRIQSETIPSFFFTRNSQRVSIENSLKQILKKGLIPVFFGYKLNVKTNEISQQLSNILFCGLVSVKPKIPQISNKITDQLDLRQIQPLFVTCQTYHEVWATISSLQYVKNKRIVNLQQASKLSLSMKIEKLLLDQIQSSKNNVCQMPLLLILSGRALENIIQDRAESYKRFACLVACSAGLVIYKADYEHKRALIQLCKSTSEDQIMAIIANRSDDEGYRLVDYHVSCNLQLHAQMYCRTLQGLNSIISSINIPLISRVSIGVNVFVHLWVYCLINTITNSLYAVTSTRVYLYDLYGLDNNLLVIIISVLMVLAAWRNWRPYKVNIWWVLIMFTMISEVYGSTQGSDQKMPLLLTTYISLALFLLEEYVPTLLALITVVLILAVYILTSEMKFYGGYIKSGLDLAMSVANAIMYRYLYELFIKDFDFNRILFNKELKEEKNNIQISQSESKPYKIREFLEYNGNYLPIQNIGTSDLQIFPFKSNSITNTFYDERLQEQYIEQKLSPSRKIGRVFEYLASVICLDAVYIYLYPMSIPIIAVCMGIELLTVLLILINQKSKICLYIYYLWKVFFRVLIENLQKHAFVVTGLIFALLTIREKKIGRYERVIFNVAQILLATFGGLTIDKLIGAGLVLFSYFCLEIYIGQCDIIERAEFSFPKVFKKDCQVTDKIIEVALRKRKVASQNPQIETIQQKVVASFVVTPIDSSNVSSIVKISESFKKLDQLCVWKKIDKIMTYKNIFITSPKKTNKIINEIKQISKKLCRQIMDIKVKVILDYGKVQSIQVGTDKQQIVFYGPVIEFALAAPQICIQKHILATATFIEFVPQIQESCNIVKEIVDQTGKSVNYFSISLGPSSSVSNIKLSSDLQNKLKSYGQTDLKIQLKSKIFTSCDANKIQLKEQPIQEEELLLLNSQIQPKQKNPSKKIALKLPNNLILLLVCLVTNVFMIFVLLFGYLITLHVLIAAVCRTLSTVAFVGQYVLFTKSQPWINLSEGLKPLVKLVLFGLLAFMPLAETLLITLGSTIQPIQQYEYISLLTSLSQAIVYTQATFKEKALILLVATFSYTGIFISVNRLPFILLFYLFCCVLLILLEIPDINESRQKLSEYISQQTTQLYETKKLLYDNVYPRVLEKVSVNTRDSAHNQVDVLVDAIMLLIVINETDEKLLKLVEEFNKLCKENAINKISAVGKELLALGFSSSTNQQPQQQIKKVINVALQFLQFGRYIDPDQFTAKVLIHTGTVYGSVLGQQRLKYQLFGTAVDQVRSLVRCVRPLTVTLSQQSSKFVMDKETFNVIEDTENVFARTFVVTRK